MDGSTGSHIDAQFRRYKMSLKYNSQHLIIVALLVGIVVYALTSLAHAVWR